MIVNRYLTNLSSKFCDLILILVICMGKRKSKFHHVNLITHIRVVVRLSDVVDVYVFNWIWGMLSTRFDDLAMA
jgi:hypothetical protein